jgi:photosystem II Psb27 protein
VSGQILGMKLFLSRLVAIVCVVVISLTGFAAVANADSLTGKYADDVVDVIEVLSGAIDLTSDNPDRSKLLSEARVKINDFASRYRRNGSVMKLSSFTTMRTALNSLAGHYSSYPNRAVPDKMKARILDEFKQVRTSLNRGQ